MEVTVLEDCPEGDVVVLVDVFEVLGEVVFVVLLECKRRCSGDLFLLLIYVF